MGHGLSGSVCRVLSLLSILGNLLAPVFGAEQWESADWILTGWICDDRRAKELKEAVKILPLDRVLVETNAPYLTPRNVPGLDRTNVPWNIVDYIWKSARLEGLAVTYPDTEAIYNGLSVQGVKVSDIVAVNNLKHAWQFVLDTLDYPTDYPSVCKINQYVGGDNLIIRAGYLRNMPVSIGGTTWKPDMPIESQIKEEMAEISRIENPTDRALTMMLYLVRKQMFLDGNKRTSMLAGNHVMISNGCGIISVPIELQPIFTGMLIHFYESNDMAEIKQFLYENCIDGIEFRPLPEQ